jgi:hypothetical protein
MPVVRVQAAPPDRHAGLVAARVQGALDVCAIGGAEVSFLELEADEAKLGALDKLEAAAFAQGLAVARVDLAAGRALASLDVVVRGVLRALRGSPRGKRGLAGVLDGFAHRHGGAAAGLLAQAHGEGAIFELARAHLRGEALRATPLLDAWIDGTDLSRTAHALPPPLEPQSAMRALRDLTRLLRALDFRGTWLTLAGADAIVRLPRAARETAFTVLRELIDNADGGRGMEAALVLVAGGPTFFRGPRSLEVVGPLQTRVANLLGIEGDAPPHRPIVARRAPPPRSAPVEPDPTQLRGLSAIVRASHGLPPIDALPALSVGMEAIDRAIDHLFAHAELDGSVFALLTGAYGSGKSHLLLHMAARALDERRPVLRLSLERLDADLGSPQRHLARLVEQATLPDRARSGPLDRLEAWTATTADAERLVASVQEIAAADEAASDAARRLLRRLPAGATGDPRKALRALLRGADLQEKPSQPSYRRDAYGRLHLWLALLERLEGCGGPLLLIDEAENLFRFSRVERRTALRSLAFYCGGALPRACVVLALTPDALERLQGECDALLAEVSLQRTALPFEDAQMLRHRLSRARPIEVPAFEPRMFTQLGEQLRALHERVRGARLARVEPRASEKLAEIAAVARTPRELLRVWVDRLERAWWYGV